MNSDRPLGPQRPNGFTHSNNITDALLLEQLIRQQRQDQELRAHLLGTTSSNPYLGLPTANAGVAWNLPPLPRDNATLAATTLSSLHLHEDSLVVAQLLRNQQQQLAANATLHRNTATNDPKALWLSKGGNPATLLHAAGASSSSSSTAFPSASSFAQHAGRVLPEPQKVPTRLDVTTNDSSLGANLLPAPPTLPKRKKKKRNAAARRKNHDADDNDSNKNSMPAPKKRKTNSPVIAIASPLISSPSTTFPLPLPNKALVTEAPKLISFQRTWGKLDKCKMRSELFRRRLGQGQVQLTGVTRSVLVQARQQQQQQLLQEEQQQQEETDTSTSDDVA